MEVRWAEVFLSKPNHQEFRGSFGIQGFFLVSPFRCCGRFCAGSLDKPPCRPQNRPDLTIYFPSFGPYLVKVPDGSPSISRAFGVSKAKALAAYPRLRR